MVGEVAFDAFVAEGLEVVVAEHHIDAETREAAVVGGAEAETLVAVGVAEGLADASIEP